MKRISIALVAFLGIIALASAVARAKDDDKWVKLGSRTVDFKGDHDTIEVGRSEGKFTKIRFKVEEGDLIMEKIKVTMGNGDVIEPETRAEFKEGTRSHDIDLPGDARVIRKVEFVYRSEHKREKADIVLYGKEK